MSLLACGPVVLLLDAKHRHDKRQLISDTPASGGANNTGNRAINYSKVVRSTNRDRLTAGKTA